MGCVYIFFSPNLNWTFLHQVHISSSLDACFLIFRGGEAAENQVFWLCEGIQKPLLKVFKVGLDQHCLKHIKSKARKWRVAAFFWPCQIQGRLWETALLAGHISQGLWQLLALAWCVQGFVAPRSAARTHTQDLTCSLPGRSLLTLPFSPAAPLQHSCLQLPVLFPFLLASCAFEWQVLALFPEKRFRSLLSPSLTSLCHTKLPLRDYQIYFSAMGRPDSRWYLLWEHIYYRLKLICSAAKNSCSHPDLSIGWCLGHRISEGIICINTFSSLPVFIISLMKKIKDKDVEGNAEF